MRRRLVAALTIGLTALSAAVLAVPAQASSDTGINYWFKDAVPGQTIAVGVNALGGSCGSPDKVTVGGGVAPHASEGTYAVTFTAPAALGTYSVTLSCADGSFTWDTVQVRVVERLPLWDASTATTKVSGWVQMGANDATDCVKPTRMKFDGVDAQWVLDGLGEGWSYAVRAPKTPGTYELSATCDNGHSWWETITVTVTGSSTTFSDVPSGAQFEEEIAWMAAAGISTGYGDGTFKPVTSVNRDAMSAFMFRLNARDWYQPQRQRFSDVAPSNQFYREISWMADSGISTGYPDGTFAPVAPVARDAMAVFLYRLARSYDYTGSWDYTPPAVSPFSDVPTTNQFYTEIAWLAESGISTGWPDGTFRPLSPVNRDAMAAFMYRFVDMPLAE